ncbi:DUF5360 family protein [Cohnella cholangitidis]|uniref:YvaD family protein n=1 Tax=Cohnella cholangitidis TaxID=2598458 RepID=A0A7G5C1I3_9BACL|nr:DUF5360 family protein [Cohnella cholangitidis]QMV43067.1 hypothetical protein FPL14_19160 [Cohnella cholangitidis]
MNKTLKTLMWVTDIGFVLYWSITWLGLIPKEYLYQDYANELLVAWNLSFVPLDLFISATGAASLILHKRQHPAWLPLCILSLSLTFCSGLQAIAFWGIRLDFDPTWWIPNLYLLIYPLFFLPALAKRQYASIGRPA